MLTTKIRRYTLSLIYLLSMLSITTHSIADVSSAENGNSDQSKFNIVSREQWGAAKPIFAMTIQIPSRTTIHHTATKQNPNKTIAQKLKGLQAFSQRSEKLADGRTKKAVADLPYHFYIDHKGTVAEGRDIQFIGDTNTSYNPSGHIAVVLEGNFESEMPTPNQIASLKGLLTLLKKKYNIEEKSIGTHQDFAQTACPSRNLLKILENEGLIN